MGQPRKLTGMPNAGDRAFHQYGHEIHQTKHLNTLDIEAAKGRAGTAFSS